MEGEGRAAELRFDVGVVGLGLIGSAALRELASAGVSCLGVGPGEPVDRTTHTGAFASHHDSGRITRHLDPCIEWAILAQRAIARYGELEALSGIRFHRPIGAVMAELDPARVAATIAGAQRLGVPVSVSGPEAPNPFAPRLAFPPGSTLLAEGGPAGHVDPRRMLDANLRVAHANGAAIVRREVGAIEEHPDGGFRLTTRSGGTARAERIVLAAGPHTDELWPGLPPLDVRGETVVLATLDADEQARLAGLPSVLARLADHPTYADLYLVPPTDYPDGTVRLKLGATSDPHRTLATPAARRAWMRGADHAEEMPALRGLVKALVPGVAAVAWETAPCLITETPSDLPYLDHVAEGLVLAAGGNGYAAKSANAIGELAARLVLEGRWTDPVLDPARFAVA
jgi:sarcosine oxidase